MVSLSMTKFHHYVLPAIPGLAIVDRLLPRRSHRARQAWRAGGGRRAGRAAAAAAGRRSISSTRKNAAAAVPLALLVRLRPQPGRARPGPTSLDFSAALIALRGACSRWRRRRCVCAARAAGRARGRCPAAAIVFTFFVLDGFMRGVAPFWSQKGPIAAYYQRRRSPEERLSRTALLARRDLLHVERDLRGPDRGADGVRPGRRRRAAQGVGRPAPRPARVLPLRALPAGAAQRTLPPEARGSFQVVDDQNNKFSPGPGRS